MKYVLIISLLLLLSACESKDKQNITAGVQDNQSSQNFQPTLSDKELQPPQPPRL